MFTSIDIGSILTRELDAFKKDKAIAHPYAIISSFYNSPDIVKLTEGFKPLRLRFGIIMQEYNKANNTNKPVVDFDNFNYSRDIQLVDAATQNNLWMWRMYVVCQLLIFAIETMNSATLYGEVCGTTPPYNYRPDIPAVLHLFKLGIFGSIKATSDIDIGIQYTGCEYIGCSNCNECANTNTQYIPGLAYIIRCVECVFKKFTGKPILDFDVELYADMIATLCPGTNRVDRYYMDTASIGLEEFKSIVQYAGASILRNYIIARGPCNNVKHIQTIADSFDFANIIPAYDKHANINPSTNSKPSANSKPSDIFNHFYDNITNIGCAAICDILTQTDWIDKIKYKVVAYLSADYTEQCNMYYKAVDAAEILVNKNRCKPDYTSRIEVMSAVAESLIYRQEGYVCPATVMHIVRGIQATHERTADNTNNANNTNNTQVPPNSNNPDRVKVCADTGEKNKYVHCLIGAYGYILSALEQLGYIYRMCIVYCDGELPGKSKCKDKLLKYDGRYKAAIAALRDLPKKTQNIVPA